MSTNNPWALYSTIPGWEIASHTLAFKLDIALEKLDRMVASGTPVSLASHAIFCEMVGVMSSKHMETYGSLDSEPKTYLAQRIQKHIREKYHVNYYVSRYGDITDY